MMKPSMPRILFVGGHGHHYLQGLRDDDGVWRRAKAAMLVDHYAPDEARNLAVALNCGDVFEDWNVAVDAFEPTVVSVGVPYGFNGCMIVKALERGLPVVSDKPIVATWGQFEAIEQCVSRMHGRVLTEFDFRAHDAFCAARKAISDGCIGEPILVTAQKSYRFGTRPTWYGSREWFGGLVLWVASHGVDAIRFVTGLEPTTVTGRGGNLSRPDLAEMEDHVALLYRLNNGGTAVVHADYLRPEAATTHGDDRLRVVGDKGQIEVRNGMCWLTNDDGQRDITDEGRGPTMAELLCRALEPDPPAEVQAAFNTQQSLHVARVLLHSRDAVDGERWIKV